MTVLGLKRFIKRCTLKCWSLSSGWSEQQKNLSYLHLSINIQYLYADWWSYSSYCPSECLWLQSTSDCVAYNV